MWKVIAGLQELCDLWDAHICQRCKAGYTGEEQKHTLSLLTTTIKWKEADSLLQCSHLLNMTIEYTRKQQLCNLAFILF